MLATKAASEEGIVAGGGTALLIAAQKIEGLTFENEEEKVGADIVRRALEAPLRQIAENSGFDGAVIANKVMEANDHRMGFDAAEGKIKDLIEAGIIDPKKVTRSALQNAASIAGVFLTTEAAITDLPKEEGAGGGMPAMPGGMGGMGMPGMM